MIDPRSQYIVYKAEEARRMLQIERLRTARERGELAPAGRPWYSTVGQWLKEKVFSRRLAERPRIAAGSASQDCPELAPC